MIDRTLVWTGSLNEAVLGVPPIQSVGLYDTTLRDGEQTVGLVLEPEQKLAIARLLDELGVGRIEAGFPRVSAEDRRAVAMIAAAGLKAEIWGFARAVVEDVEAVASLGLKSTIIEAPISDRKLKALGVDRGQMLRRITGAIAYAAERGMRVAFFGVDGSRSDLGFLAEVFGNAVTAGAQEVAVVDTIGVLSPEATAHLVGQAVAWVGPQVPVHFHGHNDFGLGTANALAAARAGAAWVHVTVNGMGERAGNANIAEVALCLEALHGIDTGLQMPRLNEVSVRVREICGYTLEPWKPLVGENLFRRETAIVASQFHDPAAIEPFSAQLVGATRCMVLGKKSGRDSLRVKCAELGITVPDDRLSGILDAVKALSEQKRGLVTNAEFRAMCQQAEA